MDIQAYIQSGILENYALGLTSDVESEEVANNLEKYPELLTELYRIEDTLATYAKVQARPMPKGLKTQIMASIANKADNIDNGSINSAQPAPEENPKPMPPSSNNTLGIFLGMALAGSLLGSLFLNQQRQSTQDELSQTEEKLETLNDRFASYTLDCDNKDATIQRLQEQLIVLKDPAFKHIILKGSAKAPSSNAIVYFNSTSGKTYLDLGNLPPAPSDKDYQLWAIVDGAPKDMGILDLTAAKSSLIEVPHIQNPEAFAVTLEARDGNPAPNLEELYAIGNV